MIFKHDNGQLAKTNVYELIIYVLARYGEVELSWCSAEDVYWAYPPGYDPFASGPYSLIAILDKATKDDYDGIVRCVR